MYRIFCALIGYLIGTIQTAYITGRAIGNTDIRKHGSGNAGTTNIARLLGTKTGVFVFFADVLKAVAAYAVCSLAFNGSGMFFTGLNAHLPGLYAAAGVITGHNFPFFLKFKGGKGSASTIGTMLVFNPIVLLITYIPGLIALFTSRMISVVSLTVSLLMPVGAIAAGLGAEEILVCAFFTVMCWFQHRQNIGRILRREEPRVFNRKRGA